MAPKRAFGGVLRPFGGGFRGPNRERASVFSGAGRGRNERGQRCRRGRTAHNRPGSPKAAAGPACSAVGPGAGRERNRRGFCGAGGGGASVFSGAGRGRAGGGCGGAGAGRGRDGVFCGGARGTKKTDLGPFTSTLLLCYSTGFCSGKLVRCPPSHDNGPALREPVSFAGDNRETIRQHVLLQQPACLRFQPARRSGSQPLAARSSNLRRRQECFRESPRHRGLGSSPSGMPPWKPPPSEPQPPLATRVSAAWPPESQPSG